MPRFTTKPRLSKRELEQPRLSERELKRPRLSKRELEQPRRSERELKRKRDAYLLENGPLLFFLICHHGIRPQINIINEWKWYGCYYAIFFSRQQNAITRSIFCRSFFNIKQGHDRYLGYQQQHPEMAHFRSSKGEPLLMSYIFNI
jgi:hypothetical protein